jgi:hypothetical protein
MLARRQRRTGDTSPLRQHGRGRVRAACIIAWFVADAVLALAPPMYLAADAMAQPIFERPAALAYFLACWMGTAVRSRVHPSAILPSRSTFVQAALLCRC